MGRRIAVLGVIGAVLGGAAAFAIVPTGPSEAATTSSTFIIPANDGYGVGDCALAGGSCGQVVANQWCEAQGFARATAFGEADAAEVTGSITRHAAIGRPIAITCGD